MNKEEIGMEQKKLRHVVLFKFNKTTTEADISGVTTAFAALSKEVSGIDGFEWGVDVSPEGLSQGFTHCYVLTFHSEADRDAYLPHPAHKAFGTLISPFLAGVFVVDYWAN
jgi:hypothetical protein